MRLVRRGIVVLILALTIIMQAPVWQVFAKLSGVVGGTGWYRAWLLDTTVAHISEWWLCGTTYTAHWAPMFVLDDDPNNIDIPNQFVSEAVMGGAIKLTLFIIIIVQCFKVLGRRIHAEALCSEKAGVLWWATGVSLFTHCVSFWFINYFDQMGVIWYWLLAAISRIACDEQADPARFPREISLESTSSETPLAVQDLVFQ